MRWCPPARATWPGACSPTRATPKACAACWARPSTCRCRCTSSSANGCRCRARPGCGWGAPRRPRAWAPPRCWARACAAGSTASACSWGRWTAPPSAPSCQAAGRWANWRRWCAPTSATSRPGTCSWCCAQATCRPRASDRPAALASTPGWADAAGTWTTPATCSCGRPRAHDTEETQAMAEITRNALFGKLNPTTDRAIESATVFCKLRGNPYVELVHWLHQLLQLEDSDLHRIVRHFALDPSKLARDVTAALDRLPRGATAISDLSSGIEEAVERAWVFATLMFGEAQVRSGYLVVGALRTPQLRNALQ